MELNFLNKMSIDKKFNDEEVWIELPPPDPEIFYHLLTGKIPEIRPIKKTKSEVKEMKIIGSIFLAATLAIGTWGLYDHIKTEYGSLGKAYEAQMEKIDKWPVRVWNTF